MSPTSTVLLSRPSSCEKTKSMGWRFVSFSLLLLALAACSDSTVPAAPGGGTGGSIIPPPVGGSGGSGATGGSGGGAGSGGTAATGGSGGMAGTGGMGGEAGSGGVVSPGACVEDSTLLTDLLPDNARWFAHRCALETCAPQATEALFKQCITDCVQEAVVGLSTECAECYGDLAWNAVPNCNTACGQSSMSSCAPICFTCGSYDAWLSELDACAGRMSVDCGDDT